MKKSFLTLSSFSSLMLFFLLAIPVGKASTHWTLQSKDYTVDTVFHAKIGPGTTQTSLSLTGGSNLKIFYTTTDLTNPYVDIRVAQAGSKLTGGAKLSAMSNANTDKSAGIEYFAGVNADFFGNSQPIGASVVNGDVYKAPGTDGWVSFYMNDAKVPGVELLSFRGTASTGDASHSVTGINMGRGENNLIVYNSHYGATTGTNSYGTEVVLNCDRLIGYNGTFECTVMGAPTGGVGSMSIPANQYVLSGHGTASSFVASLKSGDKVTLNLNTELATGGTVSQMAGGQPIILKDGVTLDTQNALDHLTALNPRTAVGYSADRKTLVLLVVDGRGMGGSAGVVSKVLADIMRSVGCSDAMNFDGGGSSELYTRSFGVRNRPSDGTERTVVNSVWAVSNAPADNEVAEICFSIPSTSLPKYGYYTPTFYAYNQYGVMLSTDLKGVTLSCPAELGEITENGSVLYANGSGTHVLTATYNGATAKMIVTIGSAQPRTRIDHLIIDNLRRYSTEVVAEVEGADMPVDNMAFQWSVDNAEIATVDQSGIISGVANGTATVTAQVDDFKASLPVTVQIPESRYINILGSDAAAWTVSKSGLSTAVLSADGKGFAFDGKISSTRNTYFSIKPSEPITLYSLPDSIRFVINPGAVSINKLDLNLKAAGSNSGHVTKNVTIDKNTTGVVTLPLSDLCDITDLANFPITLNQIYFYITGASGEEFHAEIPSVSTVYTGVSPDAAVESVIADGTDESSPILKTGAVIRGTTVELTRDSRWTLYTVSGMIAAQGQGILIDTATIPSGMYIVATENGNGRLIVR